MKVRNLPLAGGLALIAVACPGNAMASHVVVFGPGVDVSAASLAHQGPNVAGSAVNVANGNVIDNHAANGGGTAIIQNTGTAAAVSSFQDGGNGSVSLHSDAQAAANLAEGRLAGSVGATGPNNFGSPLGFSGSKLRDTVFFTNTTSNAIALTVYFSFDGFVSDTNGDSSPGGNAALYLSGCGSCGNAFGESIRFATGSNAVVGDVISGLFGETGTYLFNTQATGAVPLGQSDRWYTERRSDDGVNGRVNALMSATILIPTGETSLGIGGDLNLDCRGGSQCDFGHTSLFRFGSLADGLSFSSASGTFLSAVGVNAVPEPATWAMMIAGFGMIGAALRRRRPNVRISFV